MFIYKITNKINGKCYIGQTINSIETRWNQHKSDAKTNKKKGPLYESIRKYGESNFTIEEISGANSLTELCYQEFILIYKHNTLSPNGYNLKEGGARPNYSKESRIKMSKSAKTKRNIKELTEKMKNDNPMSCEKLIKARSKKVIKEETYSKYRNPRAIEIDIDKLKELYYNEEVYWTQQNIADYFNVDIRVIQRRIKWEKMKRKGKKPNLSMTLQKKKL